MRHEKEKVVGRVVVCSGCGQGGGTLKKLNDGYVHFPKCPPQKSRLRVATPAELAALKKGGLDG